MRQRRLRNQAILAHKQLEQQKVQPHSKKINFLKTLKSLDLSIYDTPSAIQLDLQWYLVPQKDPEQEESEAEQENSNTEISRYDKEINQQTKHLEQRVLNELAKLAKNLEDKNIRRIKKINNIKKTRKFY